MTSCIRILNDQTINQIAAGEVVENPASVVKELVENALDSGADRICVQFKAGGRQLIEVSDNGCGMSGDDALLCLERHATSKIRSVKDVEQVATMGFRGEALPSIASVCRMVIETSVGGEGGVEVCIDGGKLGVCRPSGRPRGTTVGVRDLFFNVPVRQKFLRSVSQDAGEIRRVVLQMALANPEVSFSLHNGFKILFETAATSGENFMEAFKVRVQEALGAEFGALMVPVEFSDGSAKLRALLGPPKISRPSRAGQHLFLNRRVIGSPLISEAVRTAYGTRLAEGRHPVFALHLNLPGEYLDVNVHPQKREVRLREESVLRNLIDRAVRQAFALPATERPRVQVAPSAPLEARWVAPALPEPVAAPAPSQPEIQVPLTLVGIYSRFLLVDGATLPAGLLPDADALVLVDAHLAMGRIFFERMRQGGESRASQLLMVPLTLELLAREWELLRDHSEALTRAGFGLREFGGHSFVVDAVPPELSGRDVQQLIVELLHALGKGAGRQREADRRVAVAACQAASRRGERLSASEGLELLRRLLSCEDPRHCPLGNSLFVALTEESLKKLF